MTIAAPALRIALLEDDPAYGELLRAWLASANHICHWETRAQPFMRLLTRDTFDLVILDWQLPDWIVVPGGNLGNISAFGKAFQELKNLGLADDIPRFAVINAAGADTFDQLFNKHGLRWNGSAFHQDIIDRYYTTAGKASTLASAIEINRPVNLLKALRSMEITNGVVRSVTDPEILDAKAQIGRGGFGCEPASAASVAGLKKLRADGTIAAGDRVVCILTGHQLKDPTATVDYHIAKVGSLDTQYANRPIPVANNIDDIVRAIEAES